MPVLYILHLLASILWFYSKKKSIPVKILRWFLFTHLLVFIASDLLDVFLPAGFRCIRTHYGILYYLHPHLLVSGSTVRKVVCIFYQEKVVGRKKLNRQDDIGKF